MAVAERLTAFFIDFENVYYYLKNTLADRDDANDVAVQLIQKLRQHVFEKFSETAVSLDAYADFERIEDNSQGSLYLLGVETHNVLGADHKNAADMKLCIDVMDVLYTRHEITSFIVVAGDRDYIPIIRHLKKHGRIVRVASFRGNVSGDLLTIVGEGYFIDIAQFIDPGKSAPKPTPVLLPRPGIEPLIAGGRAIKPYRDPESPAVIVEADYHRVLNIMLTHFGDKREVWMTPFLIKLRTELPQLAESDRKALVSRMQETGVVKVEKRKGEPYDYSVLLINWNHQEVRTNYAGQQPK